MHRDRIRLLISRPLRLADAVEICKGLPHILAQLDAAAAFLKVQTDENAANLSRLLKD